EMLAIQALSNGLDIEFTTPLDENIGWEADSYYVEQWPIDSQLGPQRDGTPTPVKSASVSSDRKRVFLEIDGLQAGNVVYLRLLPPCISAGGKPWSTEAWYTLNASPEASLVGKVLPRPAQPPQNVLTDAEKADGWRLLFDGQTTNGWHGFRKQEMPAGWQAIDGCLVRAGGGGDIVTNDEFGNFELQLEWRICAAGNSGIFFRVSEDGDAVWSTGPEMQVLDNSEHADGRNPLTSAGSNYAMYAPARDVTQPVGLFNQVRIIAKGPHVEHWLNGVKVVEYDIGSPDWETRFRASKFKTLTKYSRLPSGHIALQDHGDRVWYRNIKIRELK
ncbi:MAG: DUF1080 domain-containing protein, partial [Phycisphaerae bacterium]|nr:DUF1080 domain-containing protein [Phycisphaerae bacterium]